MKTSEKIKKLRIEKGYSQEKLGELIGVKKAAINKYETGRVVNIKRSTLQNLAEVFGVSPADLLDDEDMSPLTYDEEHLIYVYRQMNDIGKDKLLEYAGLLASSDLYKKCDIPGEMEA